MIWAALGLLHSLFRAMSAETNRIYRADTWHLGFWNAVIAVVIIAPFLPLMNWPNRSEFYVVAILVALILSVGQVIQLNLIAQKRGRIFSMSIPIEAFAAFSIWVFLMPSIMHYYMDNLLMTGMVVASMAVLTIAMFAMRRVDLTRETFFVVLPLGVTYAVAGIATKMIVPQAYLLPATISFLFINYAVMMVVVGAFAAAKGKMTKEMFLPKTIKAGLFTGIFSALAYMSFIMAVVHAMNPAYVSILAAMVPVWLMVYHKMRGAPDAGKPVYALFIVAAVLVMTASVYALS
jgi:hypothetical protein